MITFVIIDLKYQDNTDDVIITGTFYVSFSLFPPLLLHPDLINAHLEDENYKTPLVLSISVFVGMNFFQVTE